eukprot:g19095.t1
MTPAEFSAKYPDCSSDISAADKKYDKGSALFFTTTLVAANMELCAILCASIGLEDGAASGVCKGFNYKDTTATCELATAPSGVSDGLSSETGWYAVAFPFPASASATTCRGAVKKRVSAEYAAEAAALKLVTSVNMQMNAAAFVAKYPSPTCTVTSDRKYGSLSSDRILDTTLEGAGNMERCAILCANAPLCHAFNYRDPQKDCELVKESAAEELVTKDDAHSTWQAVAFAPGSNCRTTVIAGAAKGPQGAQGGPGSDGAQGEAGTAGTDGEAGATGAAGKSGADASEDFGILLGAGLVGGVIGGLLTALALACVWSGGAGRRGLFGGKGKGKGPGFGKGMGKGKGGFSMLG